MGRPGVVGTILRSIVIDDKVHRAVETSQIVQIGDPAVGQQQIEVSRRGEIGIDKKPGPSTGGAAAGILAAIGPVCDMGEQGGYLCLHIAIITVERIYYEFPRYLETVF